MFESKTANVALFMLGGALQGLTHLEADHFPSFAPWIAYLVNLGGLLLLLTNIKRLPPQGPGSMQRSAMKLAMIGALILGATFMPACKYWPDPKTDVVDCAKEAGRDVWATEMQHLRELINAGISYDSVASHAAGLVVRFGKPFVICLWERIRSGDSLQSGDESIRAKAYADRWLSEHAG